MTIFLKYTTMGKVARRLPGNWQFLKICQNHMDQKLIEFNHSQRKKNLPDLRVGDTVRVHRSIKEGDKERIQVFEGLVIAIKGKQSSSPTITVRKVSKNIGVEMIFPIFSPIVTKIELLKRNKVRRSKLYYMRQRFGKAAKLKVLEIFGKKEDSAQTPTEDKNDHKTLEEKEYSSTAEKLEESKTKKEEKQEKEKSEKKEPGSKLQETEEKSDKKEKTEEKNGKEKEVKKEEK